MKKVGYLIFIILVSFACSSTKGLLKKGKYDPLVKKSVKKLRVDPDDEKFLDILKQAYPMANQENQEC